MCPSHQPSLPVFYRPCSSILFPHLISPVFPLPLPYSARLFFTPLPSPLASLPFHSLLPLFSLLLRLLLSPVFPSTPYYRSSSTLLHLLLSRISFPSFSSLLSLLRSYTPHQFSLPLTLTTPSLLRTCLFSSHQSDLPLPFTAPLLHSFTSSSH